MAIFTVEIPRVGTFSSPESGFENVQDNRELHIGTFICDDAVTPNGKQIAYREYLKQVNEAKSNPGLGITRVMLKVDGHVEEYTDTSPTALMKDAIKEEAAKMLQELLASGKIKVVDE